MLIACSSERRSLASVDQRHKDASTELFVFESALPFARDLKRLPPAATDGNYESATLGELLDERRRHLFGRGSDDDSIKGLSLIHI